MKLCVCSDLKITKSDISLTHINSYVTLEVSASTALKKKCLDLNEKIAILDNANEHHKVDCRKLAEHFSVGKTTISNILRDRDYKFFKGTYRKSCHEKYHVINEILHKWYGKFTSESVYPDEPLLQEEAIEIAKRLEKEELTDFTTSNE